MRLPPLCMVSLLPLLAQTRPVSDKEVQKVHKSAILIDTHNDVTSKTVTGFELGKATTESHTDVPRMKQGGMGAQFFAVYVSASYAEGSRSAHRTLQMIDTVRRDIIERYPADFLFAVTADDILRARKQKKIAALMGVEGGHAIEDDLRLLRTFYDLGIRYMTLTHSNHNSWAESSGQPSVASSDRSRGLTDFGRGVVLEMNRLGMMVDISHVSDRTFWDALEISKAPLLASHSSCRAISPIPRNMTDEMIGAMAKKGGVVQINFGCSFLNPMAVRQPMAESGVRPHRATIDNVVAHIDHVKSIAGVDAAGLGSDFDGVDCVPEGLEDVSKWPNLTRKLLERGYTAAEIRKIYGGNLLRVMRAAEQVSRNLRGSQPAR